MVKRKSSPKKAISDAKNESKKVIKKSQKIEIRMKYGQQLSMTKRMYKEIKHLQIKTNLLIPKLSFSRLVREIMMDVGSPDLRVQYEALQALQEACEMYMVQFFEDSYLCTFHAKRKTLMLMDMRLVRMLRGRGDIINR